MIVYPQRPLPEEAGARCATIFIGGFGDWLTGRFSRVMDELPPWLPGLDEVRAYYHWDGDGFFADRCLTVRDEVDAFVEANPEAVLVFCGHSYGGSAAMYVVRHLQRRPVRLILATIDAVGRRQDPCRAPGVDVWFNAYLKESDTALDWIPKIGGRWGMRPDADRNMVASGRRFDSRGRRYGHHRPAPFFLDTLEGADVPLARMIGQALGRGEALP